MITTKDQCQAVVDSAMSEPNDFLRLKAMIKLMLPRLNSAIDNEAAATALRQDILAEEKTEQGERCLIDLAKDYIFFCQLLDCAHRAFKEKANHVHMVICHSPQATRNTFCKESGVEYISTTVSTPGN